MNDSISRWDAINAMCDACDTVTAACPHYPCKRFLAIESLPSAQTEIIRCKDCKYWHREIYNGVEYFNFSSCDLNHHGDGNNFYCADAERKEE